MTTRNPAVEDEIVQADIATAHDAIAAIQADIRRLTTERQPLADKLATAEAEVERLTRRKAELPAALTGGAGDAKVEAELAALPAALTAARERVIAYQQAVARFDRDINDRHVQQGEQRRRIALGGYRLARLAERQAGEDVSAAIDAIFSLVARWYDAVVGLNAAHQSAFDRPSPLEDADLRIARVVSVRLLRRLGGHAPALAMRTFPPSICTFEHGRDRLPD